MTDDGVGVFDVGKKCCLCCSTLSRAISLVQASVYPEIPVMVSFSHERCQPLESLWPLLSLWKVIRRGYGWEVDVYAREFSRRQREDIMSSPDGFEIDSDDDMCLF